MPCNSKRLFAEIVMMTHRKALPLELSLLMACPSTWGEKFQLANLPFPPLTLCINYNMRSSCTGLINKACPTALLWSPWSKAVGMFWVHFQQPPIPGLPSDILTVGQTLEHPSINLLQSGAWICFQIATIPAKAIHEAWILYPSHCSSSWRL